MAKQITIPDGLEALGDSFQQLLDLTQARVEAGLKGAGASTDFAAVEVEFAERSAAVERSGVAAALQALDVDAPRVTIGGEVYTRVGRSAATYHTLSGDVTVERSLYRKKGVRNAKVVDAVSLRSGAVGQGWLPGTVTAMGFLMQQGTSREAEASGALIGRVPYSHASFERVAQVAGREVVSRAASVEEALLAEFELPPGACGLSLSVDRVSVPMEEPRARPVGRPRKGAPKNPISRVYRMAYTGTLGIHDHKGEILETLYYGGMPTSGGTTVAASLARDAARLVERYPKLLVGLIADGAPEMWNLMEAACAKAGLTEVSSLIDLWHNLEKLGAASRVVHGPAGVAKAVATYRTQLLNDPEAAMKIHAELAASGLENEQVGESRPVHEAMTYLLNHLFRMDYATARAQGRPVGSGPVEAGCKTLFAVRMKRSGARWKDDSGNHVLQLRALALSNRYAEAMRLTLAPRREGVSAGQ